MPTKTKDQQETVKQPVADTPDIHHMVRKIGYTHQPEAGVITADMADAQARTWLEAGYRLAHVQGVGFQAPATIQILYIFIKD